MRLFFVIICTAISFAAQAYIPSSRIILDRVVKSNPSGPLTLENEVLIFNNLGQIQLHEVWSIENEQNFKVYVTGSRELKDKVSFQITYQNGMKNYSFMGLKKSERFSADFFDRIFLIKNVSLLASTLGAAGIYSPSQLSHSPFRKEASKEGARFNYQQEKNLRLARAGGVVAWYFGVPSTVEKKQPGLWIEQDQFVIKKIRLPSGAEMTVEKYSPVGKGYRIARNRQITWEENTAEVQTVDFKIGVAKDFNNSTEKYTEEYRNQKLKNTIEEFYLRFR